MLFNSFEFLVFLPIVFLLYWFVFRGRQWQNLLVVVASYVFYGWWDWRFLLLIALTSLCSYGSGVSFCSLHSLLCVAMEVDFCLNIMKDNGEGNRL